MHLDPQTPGVVDLIMLLSAVMNGPDVWSTQGWLRPAEPPLVSECRATGEPFSGFTGWRFHLGAIISPLFELE